MSSPDPIADSPTELSEDGASDLPTARPSEQLLIDFCDEWLEACHRGQASPRIWCGSLGRAQLGRQIAQRLPSTASVICNFLDLHQARLARRPVDPATLAITCECDPPVAKSSCDLVMLPFSAHGDAELVRETLQTAHESLRMGGQLVASTDNGADRWLRGEFEKLFPKFRTRTHALGVCYTGVKAAPLKKLKDYSCWFAFRDQGRLLRAKSRPGVFSHRRLDTGARCLMETLEVAPGQRIFEIGCGAGPVALAAAARGAGVHVHAIDSNPRAVECLQAGAEENQLAGIQARVEAEGRCDTPGEYDIAVANPPYYSRHRLAALFVDAAYHALRPAGQLLVVTKEPMWYAETLPERFDDVELLAVRSYYVVRALKQKS